MTCIQQLGYQYLYTIRLSALTIHFLFIADLSIIKVYVIGLLSVDLRVKGRLHGQTFETISLS